MQNKLSNYVCVDINTVSENITQVHYFVEMKKLLRTEMFDLY